MSAPQKSPEWFEERKGKLTASTFGQAAGMGPGSRQQLWRRTMGLETFEGNPATQWGEENEENAVISYAKRTWPEPKIERVGFVIHPGHAWLGCSPDILINDDGIGEIKCPFTQKLYDEIPMYYMAQVQGQLEITNRQWAAFICWTPERMRVWRVERSSQYWDWLHLRLADFWTWVAAKIEPPREKKVKEKDIPIVGVELIYEGES